MPRGSSVPCRLNNGSEPRRTPYQSVPRQGIRSTNFRGADPSGNPIVTGILTGVRRLERPRGTVSQRFRSAGIVTARSSQAVGRGGFRFTGPNPIHIGNSRQDDQTAGGNNFLAVSATGASAPTTISSTSIPTTQSTPSAVNVVSPHSRLGVHFRQPSHVNLPVQPDISPSGSPPLQHANPNLVIPPPRDHQVGIPIPMPMDMNRIRLEYIYEYISTVSTPNDDTLLGTTLTTRITVTVFREQTSYVSTCYMHGVRCSAPTPPTLARPRYDLSHTVTLRVFDVDPVTHLSLLQSRLTLFHQVSTHSIWSIDFSTRFIEIFDSMTYRHMPYKVHHIIVWILDRHIDNRLFNMVQLFTNLRPYETSGNMVQLSDTNLRPFQPIRTGATLRHDDLRPIWGIRTYTSRVQIHFFQTIPVNRYDDHNFISTLNLAIYMSITWSLKFI